MVTEKITGVYCGVTLGERGVNSVVNKGLQVTAVQTMYSKKWSVSRLQKSYKCIHVRWRVLFKFKIAFSIILKDRALSEQKLNWKRKIFSLVDLQVRMIFFVIVTHKTH